jgi:hypothetical protein
MPKKLTLLRSQIGIAYSFPISNKNAKISHLSDYPIKKKKARNSPSANLNVHAVDIHHAQLKLLLLRLELFQGQGRLSQGRELVEADVQVPFSRQELPALLLFRGFRALNVARFQRQAPRVSFQFVAVDMQRGVGEEKEEEGEEKEDEVVEVWGEVVTQAHNVMTVYD